MPSMTNLKDDTQVRQNSSGSTQNWWDYQWTAPPAGTGTVTFYAATLSGNGSGTGGDGCRSLVYHLDEETAPTATATMTASQTAVLSATGSTTPTGTPMLSATPSASATSGQLTATLTGEVTGTATPTGTLTGVVTGTMTPWATSTATAVATGTGTVTATLTPAPIVISLQMPATSYAEGDACWLSLSVVNPGSTQIADLYVLMDVFGAFYAYPGWGEISSGIDFETVQVEEGLDATWELIPEFLMPAVAPAGPFYFYAALFESGHLDLDHLVSNGSSVEFRLTD
jgi:hypothetical protein